MSYAFCLVLYFGILSGPPGAFYRGFELLYSGHVLVQLLIFGVSFVALAWVIGGTGPECCCPSLRVFGWERNTSASV